MQTGYPRILTGLFALPLIALQLYSDLYANGPRTMEQLSAASSSLVISQEKSSEIKNIESRALRLYNAWKNEDPKTMWDLTDPDLRKYSNFDEGVQDLEELFKHAQLLDFKIRRINYQDGSSIATAETDMKLYIRRDSREVETNQLTYWRLNPRDKLWYCEGLR